MNAKSLLAFAAFSTFAGLAAVASPAAYADEYNGGERALQFNSTRTRAEVMSESVVEARTHSTIPTSSRVAERPTSGVQVQDVRRQAIEALRLGRISSGEAGQI